MRPKSVHGAAVYKSRKPLGVESLEPSLERCKLFAVKIPMSGKSALSSAELCRTSIHGVVLAAVNLRTFATLSFLHLNLVPAVKESAGNEGTSRTAAGVGVSMAGVGVSVVEGRGLCR
jgi:hypothetical protein